MDGSVVARRSVIAAGLGLAGGALLQACSAGPEPSPNRSFTSPQVRPTPGQHLVAGTLNPRPVTVDLGGPVVRTWAYGDAVPGRAVHATAGDLLRMRVVNGLPAPTTVHWHGIRLGNAADGVPGLNQAPIAEGATYDYVFTVPDPGTYFLHPHVGVQLDRGLYAALVVDDPAEPGDYDEEWVLVLDDWLDGTGRSPDDVLRGLREAGAVAGAGGMGVSRGRPFGHPGDITHPHHLVNGRVPVAPDVLASRPGRRVRLRIVNAASDTVFAVALADHLLTVTHPDGYAVTPLATHALYIGMGERYDAVVTLRDGVFPFVAAPVGRPGLARALVRTGGGTVPGASARPDELNGSVLMGSRLVPADASRLPGRSPDAWESVVLTGS